MSTGLKDVILHAMEGMQSQGYMITNLGIAGEAVLEKVADPVDEAVFDATYGIYEAVWKMCGEISRQ